VRKTVSFDQPDSVPKNWNFNPEDLARIKEKGTNSRRKLAELLSLKIWSDKSIRRTASDSEVEKGIAWFL